MFVEGGIRQVTPGVSSFLFRRVIFEKSVENRGLILAEMFCALGARYRKSAHCTAHRALLSDILPSQFTSQESKLLYPASGVSALR